jgi:hypothetical protein
MPSDLRSNVASEQQSFLAALVSTSEAPIGVDQAKFVAAKEALLRKRARSVAKSWPGLARDLGALFFEDFSAFAEGEPVPQQGGPLADGFAFARWWARSNSLSEAARLEILAVRLQYVQCRAGLVPRRSPAMVCRVFQGPRRLVIGVRLPWLGAHWTSIPLARAAAF